MTKQQAIKDVSALINGSDSPEQSDALIHKYLKAIETLRELGHWAKVNNHVPDGKMKAQSDEEFEFGGGSFGGGGASGKW